jgi:thiol-disulfide isomerase/thioredoxin
MARKLAAAALLAALLAPPAPVRADDPGAEGADADLPAEGQPAPRFQLRPLDPSSGRVDWVSLDRFAGEEPEDEGSRVVLLSFFASWCGPCRKEMPFLEALHQSYRDRGLRVISVNIDREEPGLSEARKLVKSARVSFPVLTDRFNLLARRYLGERSPLPSVFLIRRDGTIARIERGYGKDAKSFLISEVRSALGLAQAAAPR